MFGKTLKHSWWHRLRFSPVLTHNFEHYGESHNRPGSVRNSARERLLDYLWGSSGVQLFSAIAACLSGDFWEKGNSKPTT